MSFLLSFNQLLWGGPLLVLLMGLHIYHTVHLRFVQRKIGTALRLSLGDTDEPGQTGFSRFGSLTTTLAATLGTGNIVGVSTAVFLGGPGAVFWCWLTGVFGMATTYAETYLCTRFRGGAKSNVSNENNSKKAGSANNAKNSEKANNMDNPGGPMYVLRDVLKKPGMAFLYSLFLCLSAFCIGCTTQSNAITESCEEVFHLSPVLTAIVTAFAVGLVLMQGKKWIESFTIAVVPAMAMFFFGGCALYLILHRAYFLPAIKQILSSAFGLSQIGGGITGFTLGKAVRYGVARGLFTNEAGLGTAGLIAGNSAEKNARNQALISMSASFWDTVVLCAVTGIVLASFQLEYPAEWICCSAGSLTAAAFSKLPFFGDEILAVAVVCFALATLVGWSYYGRQGFSYLFHGKGSRVYQTIYIIMIFVGGVLPLNLVWELTDFINLFLLIPAFYMLVRCRNMVRP